MASLAEQTYAFLMTILAGGVIGLLFDVYRALRAYLRPKQFATAITDLFYWIVVTPTVFAMLLAGNWGELRLYVLIGLVIGLILYFQALSAVVIWFVMGLIKGIGRGISRGAIGLFRIIALPFTAVGMMIGTRRNRGMWQKKRRSRVAMPGTGFPRLRMAWQRLSFLRLFQR